VSPTAGMELNVATRTLEISGEHAWMGCGGGIVADSDPQAELEEALIRARPIAKALNADVRRPPSPTRLRRPTAKRWPRRPDPSKGLLETIAVRDGTPVDLDRHLERLARSARALYEQELPRIELPATPHGRIRILARPAAHGLQVDVEVHADLPEPQPVVLEPRRLAGGLGAHKWLDRPQHQDLLIVDLDGSVLEAAWANVWISTPQGVLVTPPADGRILPGVTRRRLLEAPTIPTAVRPISLAELRLAPAILLTSALRVVTPAGLDRPATPASSDLAARLVHSLNRVSAHCCA
jgi:para-aminobenzoate synthetase/4-amino-4-deoxychorismate lyase